MTLIRFFAFLFFMSVSPWVFAEGGSDGGGDDGRYSGIYIGGGHPMGLRFATAGSVCMLVADAACSVLASGDSLQSLDALAAGVVDMAVVQSDWLYHAVDGTSRFRQLGANADLRVLAVLGVETVLVAVRKSSGVRTVADLRDRTFFIGADKTYRGLFGKALLKAAGIRQKSVTLVQSTTDEAIQSLCSGTADASVFVVSTPNGMMDTLTAQCDVVFLSLGDTVVGDIQKSFKGVFPSTIASDVYWNQSTPIRSLGLYTVLVTTAGLDGEKAGVIQSAIYNNVQQLRTMHPAFSVFSKDFVVYDVGVPYYTPPVP